MELSEFLIFVKEILASNSKNYKLDILKKYKTNESVKYFLKFVYDNYITTGISEKKLQKLSAMKPTAGFVPVIETLEYLKVHNTGSDADLAVVAACQRGLSGELLDLFNKIISKNLQLGVDVKSINKIIPGVCSSYQVMLANKYFDNPKVVEGKTFALTTKMDGTRITMFKDNGVVTFYTRQGQAYEGLVELEAEAKRVFPDDIVLDGELLYSGEEQLDSNERFKKTIKKSTLKSDKKTGLSMIVFDYIPLKEFKTQTCSLSYRERRQKLNKLFEMNSFKFFKLLPLLYFGDDTSKIKEILDQQLEKKEEGVMINIWDAPYVYGRTNNLLKVKLFNSYDLEIVGVEEGINKYAGKLGAVLVRYKNGNIVKVGSGFSDKERKAIWVNSEDYIGKLIEVSYFEETTNDDGGESLRFPTFKCFRTDKNTPDF